MKEPEFFDEALSVSPELWAKLTERLKPIPGMTMWGTAFGPDWTKEYLDMPLKDPCGNASDKC